MGVSPRRKDILLEYDWFDDANDPDWTHGGTTCPGAHTHRPTPAALSVVTTAFAAAPVSNPDGSTGINVIHDYGQGGVFSGGTLVADADGIVIGAAGGTEYNAIAATHHSAARAGYFHYVLMPHRYVLNNDNESSGYALFNSNRMMVSLYCHADNPLYVGRTIMHELGHNLGLRHGGGDYCNFKPNYNSVMNYRFQFEGTWSGCDGKTPTTSYSTGTMSPLNEAALDETNALCGLPFDWNSDGVYTVGLTFDLNNYADQFNECAGQITTLIDHDDWNAINFAGVSAGAPLPGGIGCAAPPTGATFSTESTP